MENVNDKSLAPVILFTYARPKHTKMVLESLANNMLAKRSKLFIFCDAPKKPEYAARNEEVRRIISSDDVRARFKEVNITYAEKNKGLANSIIDGVTQVINQYGKCIVLEDDNITGKNFLKYMNLCLDEYEANKSIWSISGYTGDLKALEAYPEEVYLSYRACSTGWGTWKDRWSIIDWKVKDFHKLSMSPYLRYKFNRGGNDLYRMLRHQVRGERDSWAIRFCYAQSKNDMYTVYPKKTFIFNIGYDGTGVHCQNDTNKNADVTEFDLGLDLRNIKNAKLDGRVIRDFKKQYQVSFAEAVDWGIRQIKKRLNR